MDQGISNIIYAVILFLLMRNGWRKMLRLDSRGHVRGALMKGGASFIGRMLK